MATRNFYMIGQVDGRKTTLEGGPKRKDGEMIVQIFQREKGEKVEVFRILCKETNGVLKTTVVCKADETIEPLVYESER